MTQKKLQKDSNVNTLDLDHDGVVDDQELKALAALEAAEKMDAQRRMAWATLAAMGAGLVGAYMSVSVWMAKGK
jgi:hypothetical protein